MISIAARSLIQSNLLDIFIAAEGYLEQRRNITYKKVSHAAIELTYGCNSSCPDCYIPKNLRTNHVMDESLLRRVIDQFRLNDIKSIGLLGGEPLMDTTVPTISRVAGDNPFTPFAIITNGRYIAENGIHKLEHMHNITYNVSIDGFSETNDLFRGNGSFDNVQQSFRVLRAKRKVYGSVTTLRKENLAEATSKEFLDMLCKRGVQIAGFLKMKTISESMISAEEFEEANRRMQPLISQYPMIIVFGGNGKGYSETKDYCYRSLYVNPKGDVRLSKVDLGENLGNLAEQDLEHILKKIKTPSC